MNAKKDNEIGELSKLEKSVFVFNGIIAIAILGLSSFYPDYFSDMIIYKIKASLILHSVIMAILFNHIIIKKNPKIKSLVKNKKKLLLLIFIWILSLVLTINTRRSDGFSELYVSILSYALTFGTWCSIFMEINFKK